MNLPFYIARRYLFSRKSLNIINIISIISMAVVAIVTAAMIVVLSAFNGIEALIDDRYSALDADITIEPIHSKTMGIDSLPVRWLMQRPGLRIGGGVVEENVVAEFDRRQRIVRIKGLEVDFHRRSGLDSMIVEGNGVLMKANYPQAILGAGVRYELGATTGERAYLPLRLSALLRGQKLSRSAERALSKKDIHPGGTFSINVDFDTRYVLVPLEFAQSLLGYNNEVSAFEMKYEPGTHLPREARQIEAQLGPDYRIRTRYQKNEIIHKTNQSEKWITFFILIFIMLIATFNIIASLVMLIIDKRRDMQLLASMGATMRTIRRIFFLEGALINGIGAGVGLALGFGLCWAQQEFGLVRLEGGLVPYYPVKVVAGDLLVVFSIVLFTGLISSIVPVRIYTRKGLQAKT